MNEWPARVIYVGAYTETRLHRCLMGVVSVVNTHNDPKLSIYSVGVDDTHGHLTEGNIRRISFAWRYRNPAYMEAMSRRISVNGANSDFSQNNRNHLPSSPTRHLAVRIVTPFSLKSQFLPVSPSSTAPHVYTPNYQVHIHGWSYILNFFERNLSTAALSLHAMHVVGVCGESDSASRDLTAVSSKLYVHQTISRHVSRVGVLSISIYLTAYIKCGLHVTGVSMYTMFISKSN